jgi:GNAT superfamily N-acetyltransferase
VALALNSPGAICRLIVAGSEPVGYAQALDAVLLEEALEAGLAAGTWQCALFIGSQAHSGRGLGGMALQALLAEVFGSTLAVACAIRVPVRNERAVRTIEGQGFRWLRVESDAPLGPLWLMLLERPRA